MKPETIHAQAFHVGLACDSNNNFKVLRFILYLHISTLVKSNVLTNVFISFFDMKILIWNFPVSITLNFIFCPSPLEIEGTIMWPMCHQLCFLLLLSILLLSASHSFFLNIGLTHSCNSFSCHVFILLHIVRTIYIVV